MQRPHHEHGQWLAPIPDTHRVLCCTAFSHRECAVDLVQRIAADLKIDEGKAERGIGAILAVLRVSVGREAFDRVKDALPGSERWVGRALMSGGRTAELPALGAPSALGAALAAAGYDAQEVPHLARIALDVLRPILGDPATERLLAAAPGLRS
jgi:hypothetical protein